MVSIVPQLDRCLKGPVKLIKRVKIAHSFLQSVSNQFQVIILSLPMACQGVILFQVNILSLQF